MINELSIDNQPTTPKLNIIQGDQEQLFKSIADNSIDIILTDPPYSMLKHKIETQFCFDTFLNNCYRVLKKDGWLVYTTKEPIASDWVFYTKKLFYYKLQMVWDKIIQTSFFGSVLPCHELVYFFSKSNSSSLNKILIDQPPVNTGYTRAWSNLQKFCRDYPNKTLKEIMDICYNLPKKLNKTNDTVHPRLNRVHGDFYLSRKLAQGVTPKSIFRCRSHNMQKFNKDAYNIKHPTVKPIQLFTHCLKLIQQNRNEIVVLDPFTGSGTTGLSCKELGLNFIGFEIYKEYVNIAKKRIYSYSHQEEFEVN